MALISFSFKFSFSLLIFYFLVLEFSFSEDFVKKDYLSSVPCPEYPAPYSHHLVPSDYIEDFLSPLSRQNLLKIGLGSKHNYFIPHFDNECFSVVVDFAFIKAQCVLPIKCGSPRALVLSTKFFGFTVTHLCYGSGMSFEEGKSTFHSLTFLKPFYHPMNLHIKTMSSVDKKIARDLGYRFDSDTFVVMPSECFFEHAKKFGDHPGDNQFVVQNLGDYVQIKYDDYFTKTVSNGMSCSTKHLIKTFGLLNFEKRLDKYSFTFFVHPQHALVKDSKTYYFNISEYSACRNFNHYNFLIRIGREKSAIIYAGFPSKEGSTVLFDFEKNLIEVAQGPLPYEVNEYLLPIDNLFVGFLHSVMHKLYEVFEKVGEFLLSNFIKEIKFLLEDVFSPIFEFLLEGLWDLLYQLFVDFWSWLIKHPFVLQNMERIITSVLTYFLVFLLRGRHIESVFVVFVFLFFSVAYGQCTIGNKPSTLDVCVYTKNINGTYLLKDVLVSGSGSNVPDYCLQLYDILNLTIARNRFSLPCDVYRSYKRSVCSQNHTFEDWIDGLTTCIYTVPVYSEKCDRRTFYFNRKIFNVCEKLSKYRIISILGGIE